MDFPSTFSIPISIGMRGEQALLMESAIPSISAKIRDLSIPGTEPSFATPKRIVPPFPLAKATTVFKYLIRSSLGMRLNSRSYPSPWLIVLKMSMPNISKSQPIIGLSDFAHHHFPAFHKEILKRNLIEVAWDRIRIA